MAPVRITDIYKPVKMDIDEISLFSLEVLIEEGLTLFLLKLLS